MDEKESQRAELRRLLSTATDAKRRKIVERAIAALDADDEGNDTISASTLIGGKGGYMTTMNHNLNRAVSELDIGVTKHTDGIKSGDLAGRANISSPNKHMSSSGRPMSSRQRRPSTGAALDAIPENRILKQRTLEKNVEAELEPGDVFECCASSWDQSHPPASEILSTGSEHVWLSTGMFPQQFSLSFNQHWIFRKIQVVCDEGVDEVSIYTRSSGTSDQTWRGPYPTERFSNMFIFEVRKIPSLDSPDGVWGNQLRLHFPRMGTSHFVSVFGIQVIAVIYGGHHQEGESKKPHRK